MRLAAVCFMLLFSGCLVQPVESVPQAAPGECAYRAEPEVQSTTFGAGTMYLQSPAGTASWNGRRLEFRWHDDPERLIEMTVTVEWNNTLGSERALRTGILHPSPSSFQEHWTFGPFNGPSPLQMVFGPADAKGIGESILVDVGTTTEGPSSVALVDHEVRVTLQESYWCEDGIPPASRMSR